MKGTKNVLLLATLFAVAVPAVYSAAQDVKVPTRKELVTLLKTAQEPPEHLRIAAYYKHEAARLRQEAKQHEELAAFYTENKSFAAMQAQYGKAFGPAESHCKKFAELEIAQAKESDALAALHSEMAKEAAQKH